jgi:hypothetical protein
MSKVAADGVVSKLEASESPLPAQIQGALGELVGAARGACSRSRSVSAWVSFTS